MPFVQRTVPSKRRGIVDAVAILTLSIWVALLYYPSLALGWTTFDDVIMLLQAEMFSPRDYFFTPDVYRLLSSANLTPWVTLSYDFDLALFGIAAEPFRIHQLLAIAILVAGSYLFIVRWCGPLVAWVSMLLFSVSAPVAAVATTLSMRHYSEGGIMAVLALHSYYVATHHRGWKHKALILLSAAAYAGAVTAKEVFVPLVVVLFVIDHGTWIGRLRRLWLHALVAVLYSLWRIAMLGGAVAGYALPGGGGIASSLDGAWFMLRSLPDAAFLSPLTGLVFISALIALLTFSILRRQIGPLFFATIFICVLAPVAPVGMVAAIMGLHNSLRYFLVAMWAACLGFAFAVDRIASPTWRAIWISIALVCALRSAAKVHIYNGALLRGLPQQIAACIDFALASDSTRALELRQVPMMTDGLAGAVQLNRTSVGQATADIVTGPLTLPTGFDRKLLYVQTGSPPWFVEGPSRKNELLENARKARAIPGIVPQLDWLRDSVAWSIPGTTTASTSVVVRSASGSFEIPEAGNTGSLETLRQKLWLYRVHAPADIIFAWTGPDGIVRYTSPLEVPSRYLAFWEVARGG